MDTSSSPVPPPPLGARKRSKLGIGSFISAMVALLFTIFAILDVPFWSPLFPALSSEGVGVIIMAIMCLGGLAALVGTGLGIGSVMQKGTRNTFGIIGLVISALILLGVCTISANFFM